MNQLVKGKLKKKSFNTINMNKFDDPKKKGPKKVLVFVVGGITYQENRELQLEAQKNNFNIVVGSNTLLSSQKFIDQLEKLTSDTGAGLEDEQDRLINKKTI